MFKKLINGLGGDLIDTAVDTFKDYFPPDMSPADKAALDLKLAGLKQQAQAAENAASAEAERLLNERIAQYEGTASDLKSIWLLGPLMLFLRGLQRPIWGYATLWMDIQWFSTWTTSEAQDYGLILINFLVLGFLFGERAIKNAMPIITRFMEAKKA